MGALNQKFNVLILCAGIGERMGTSGKITPKCLLKINKKYLIENIIEDLINQKIPQKNITLAVGYKSYKIKKILNKKYKLQFINIPNYDENGSSFSWFCFERKWKLKKLPLVLMHADMYYDKTFLKKVLISKHENLISSVLRSEKFLKKRWVIQKDRKNKIIKFKNIYCIPLKSYNEVGCVNKFSSKYADLIFKYMKRYFRINGKNFTWEIVINDFIKNKKIKIYSPPYKLKYWFNINTKDDLKAAKSYAKKTKI